MKKITFPFFVLVALIGLLIAATPKKQMPPNFESAFTTFSDALENYANARQSNSPDTVAYKAALASAQSYIRANWTSQQVTNNVEALWPIYPSMLFTCLKHCAEQYYQCSLEYPDGDYEHYKCVDQYNFCKWNCNGHL